MVAWLINALKCNYEHNTIAFEDHGVYVLLIGERDVPPTPIVPQIYLPS